MGFWSQVVPRKVAEEVLPWYKTKGIVPSLREIYYRLVASNTIPNTKSAYKQLSECLVTARMLEIVGWNDIADESRQVYNDDIKEYISPEDYVQIQIEFIKKAQEFYRFPRWYLQKNYVEVWLEKLAMVGTIQKFVEGKDVRVVPTRGFDGWGDGYKHAIRLAEIKRSALENNIGIKIHILYLGDFDPSGIAIDKHLRQQLDYFGFYDAELKRIAVTENQIEQFHLPHKPDQKTQEKLRRDPRTDMHALNRGELKVVELEALTAYAPDEFEKLIQDRIDGFLDAKIYESTRLEETKARRTIPRLVQNGIDKLNDDSRDDES